MWFTLAILSYIFFALATFLDKYILGKVLLSPKIYSFYTGVLALSVLLLIPVGYLVSSEFFFIPSLPLIILSLVTGITFVLFLFSYYKGIRSFEVSRIVPAVGGITPIFILGLVYLLVFVSPNLGFQKRILTPREFLALTFLILGSVILTLHRKKLATLESLKISIIASFLLGLSFVLSKLVYVFFQSFWPGFIWIGLGQVLGAMFFLVFREVRNEIFAKKGILRKKVAFTFLSAKIAGSLGSILQNGAIFLAPVIFISMINALSGIQYVFLIILTTLFFFKSSKILKEEISKRVLLQKALAVWLIITGLALLSLG